VGDGLTGCVDGEDAARFFQAVGFNTRHLHRAMIARARVVSANPLVRNEKRSLTRVAGRQGLLDRPLVRKLFRYSLTSLAGVAVGQSTLVLCVAVLGWPGVASNLVAVSAGTVPNYLLNRYWTWQKFGRNRFFGEVLPFWTMTLLGLLLSTIAVAYADHRWGTTFAISAANLSGFGVLWVAKFLLLDRVLFATRP
jgi:putative flippase GtrA